MARIFTDRTKRNTVCLDGMNRARGFNNKGLVNEHRKPKAAYFAVKEAYKKFKAEENK